jgi:hypothetical protein
MTAPSTAADQTLYRPFTTFSFVWGVTTLVHQLAFTFWTESWQGWVLVVAAIAVIQRPGCVLRFGVLVISSLLHLWEKLPFVPNHILYEGMLHLIMLLALAAFFFTGPGRGEFGKTRAVWKSRSLLLVIAILAKAGFLLVPGFPQGHVSGALTTLFLLVALGRFLFAPATVGSGEVYFSKIAPVLRAAIIIMYIWAVIQKLNWDYFDPEVSCAGKLHKEIAAYFGGIVPTATWALHAAAVGSLIFEFSIPILLYCSRTRYVGFVAAVLFHLWLSIHFAAGIFSFTSLILAFLLLFLPLEWGQRLQDLWDRQSRRIGGGDLEKGRRRAHALVIGVFFAVLVTQGALYLSIARSYDVFWTANRIGFFAFFTWGVWFGACYLVSGWGSNWKTAPLPNRATATIAWVGLLPVLLNGVWPWVGGRTQTSFSMYSNLRSEAAGNHMFLKRVDLFKLQTDMVEVLTSAPDILAPSKKPRGIQQFAHPGHRIMPWFEFRRLVSEMEGDFEVTYTRNGKEESLGRKDGKAYGDAAAFETLPLWSRKFVWFRRLESLEGPMCCTH